jgi:hypothetical protein
MNREIHVPLRESPEVNPSRLLDQLVGQVSTRPEPAY